MSLSSQRPKLKERSSNPSSDTAEIMAKGDWEHKEEFWQNTDGRYTEQNQGFADWLDEHCAGGWEVLKISRNFQSAHQNTWVVFRKQV